MITPIIPLDGIAGIRGNVFAKHEGVNMTGSMKIRSTRKILDLACLAPGSTIIESTSGNMGVALAYEAERRNLRCELVVDPKLSPFHRKEMNGYGVYPRVVYVEDDTGGWLKTRLAFVKELIEEHPDWYWVNQYENPWNPLAFEELGVEIVKQLEGEIKAVGHVILFMAVSTGGSLTGVARVLKEWLPTKRVTVVAVDAKGSAIFGQKPEKRYLNGIGSSLSNPPNLDRRLISRTVIVDDASAFTKCWELKKNGISCGGSSGAVVAAIAPYGLQFDEDNLVITVFPDHGSIYEETIYSRHWLAEKGFDLRQICVG